MIDIVVATIPFFCIEPDHRLIESRAVAVPPVSRHRRVTLPVDADDRDLLSGIAVMTLAIANRELASQGFPETLPLDETTDPDLSVPQPCGVVVVADGTSASRPLVIVVVTASASRSTRTS
jgi:hypothetical protein